MRFDIAHNFPTDRADTKVWRLGAMEMRLTELGHIVAANLNKIMAEMKDKGDQRKSNLGLAKRAGVSNDTVGRARKGDANLTLKNLTKIAKALGVTPLQMLCPNLDPKDPPEVVYNRSEKIVLRAFREKAEPDLPNTRH